MTSYLIKSGALPFTGSELCGELGIDIGFSIDLDDMITVACLKSGKPVLASIWRVSEGPRFAEEILHHGVAPVSIGVPVEYAGDMFRDCTYVADPAAVAAIRASVLAEARDLFRARRVELGDVRLAEVA